MFVVWSAGGATNCVTYGCSSRSRNKPTNQVTGEKLMIILLFGGKLFFFFFLLKGEKLTNFL